MLWVQSNICYSRGLSRLWPRLSSPTGSWPRLRPAKKKLQTGLRNSGFIWRHISQCINIEIHEATSESSLPLAELSWIPAFHATYLLPIPVKSFFLPPSAVVVMLHRALICWYNAALCFYPVLVHHSFALVWARQGCQLPCSHTGAIWNRVILGSSWHV